MQISPAAARRYLTDDAVTGLAQTMAMSVAEETPGADLLDAARTAALPVPILGRAVAALAEALQVRLRERDDIEHLRTVVAQLAHELSALGQLTADSASSPAGTLMMPPGLLHRAARYLEAAAVLVDGGVLPAQFDSAQADQLAETFRRDAASLRYYAGE